PTQPARKGIAYQGPPAAAVRASTSHPRARLQSQFLLFASRVDRTRFRPVSTTRRWYSHGYRVENENYLAISMVAGGSSAASARPILVRAACSSSEASATASPGPSKIDSREPSARIRVHRRVDQDVGSALLSLISTN